MPGSYPGSLWTFTPRTDDVDDVLAIDYNAPAQEIVNVQTELGTNPKGNYASVKDRLEGGITTIVSSATPTINTDTSQFVDITALAAAITSFTTNLSGSPTNFQKLIIRIKDNGTARALAWGAKFQARGATLPTTTILGKVLTVGFIYDTTTAKWGCVASVQEA